MRAMMDDVQRRKSRVVIGLFMIAFSIATCTTVWLLWVYVTPIVLAMIMVSIFGGVFERAAEALGQRRALAAGLTTAVLMVAVVVPVGVFVGNVVAESIAFIDANQPSQWARMLSAFLAEHSWLYDKVGAYAGKFGLELSPAKFVELAASVGGKVSVKLYDSLSAMAANTLSVLFDFGVMAIAVFALFAEGARLKQYLFDLSPLPDVEEQMLVDRFKDLSRAVLIGNGTASLLQGLAGGIGMSLFGLGNPVVWGALIGFLAFLPIVGASAVFLPVAGYMILTGQTVAAIGFLAYNFVYVALLEYLVKPRLIGGKSQLHPVVVFIAILAGLSTFGILGLFYGPLILTMFLALAEIYKLHYRDAVATAVVAQSITPPINPSVAQTSNPSAAQTSNPSSAQPSPAVHAGRGEP